MLKVNRRGGFSDRQGISPINTDIQVHKFDQRTRIQLLNLVSNLYKEIYGDQGYWYDNVQDFLVYVYQEVFCQAVNRREDITNEKFFGDIEEVFRNATYDEILTFLEAISDYWKDKLVNLDKHNNPYKRQKVSEVFNDFFKREYVGYRFINGVISPISDEMEVETINSILKDSYGTVSEHISKANLLLADRDQPDYENSIKESISAVEAMCKIITESSGADATLGVMLKKLESNGVTIHPALKSAFSTLYGYTSDANGIRHARNIGGEASTFDEAKFMLISCCAFINYLKGVIAS